MKQTTKMSRAVSQLEHIYNALNTDFFDGALPVPIITVQSQPGTMGHTSVSKVWKRPDGNTYELNIAAEVLDYAIEETLDTCLHEMIHVFCRENSIKECSRGGTYHNKRFKDEAEKRGLTCYYTKQYGWNTTPRDTLVEYALSKGWNEIRIARSTPIRFGVKSGSPTETGATTPGQRTSSTRKVQCLQCGQSVRATKTVNILCGDCMIKMEEV